LEMAQINGVDSMYMGKIVRVSQIQQKIKYNGKHSS
jgi:hypothetical protein